MRLIDANALNFEKLQDTNGEAVPANEYIAFLKGAMAAEESIKNAPTIDAEPVVRCRDCRYFMRYKGCPMCNKGLITVVEENHYCSCGAKMDEGQ